MSTLSITVRYRPVRIGWCVQSGNWEQYRTALRLTHCFAGGKFNPIIPVDQPDLAEYLIDCLRVDLLFPVADVAPTRVFVEAHAYLPWPEHAPRLFWEQWDDRPPYAAFVDVYHTAKHLNEKHIQGVEAPTFSAALVSWDDADPLGDVLLATVGSYAQPSREMPDYRRVLTRWLNAGLLPLSNGAVLPAELGTLLSPSRLAAAELSWYGGDSDHGIYVGAANDFTDLINFWNLRAAGIELAFADFNHWARLEPMLNEHKRRLEGLPRRPWREVGDVAIWGQPSLEGQDLSRLGPRLLRHSTDPHIWNGLNVKPVTPFWSERVVLGSVDESDRTPSATFALPEKPVDEDRRLHGQRIVTSLSGFDSFVHDKNVTFFPPYVPELNKYYGNALYRGSGTIRSEYDDIRYQGFAIFTSILDSHVTLTSLSALELTANLFKTFGIAAEPSRAGLVTSRLIAQMGGLQGCRAFKIEGVRKLVATHSPDQHFDRTVAHQTIGNWDEGTKQMRFQDFEDLHLGPRQHSKLKPPDVLADLLSHKVFRVGMELACPHCELPFWQPLDDLATVVECQMCGSDFDITGQLKDRNWAYRRSGLFGRDDHQQGGIPVAVTLQQLDSNLHPPSGFGFLYTTSLNLSPVTAQISKCETDFCVITSGYSHNRRHHPQVIIGECKAAGGTITVEDAKHLAQVADSFSTRRVSTFIVFAKTGEFSGDEIKAAAVAQDGWVARVILLSKDELEPYDVLHRHPDSDRSRLHVEGLEGLAQFTVHRYPELRPRDLPP